MAKNAKRRREGARLLAKWERTFKICGDRDRLAKLSYGKVFKQDPFDCGNPQCGICTGWKVKEKWATRTSLRKSERDSYLELE